MRDANQARGRGSQMGGPEGGVSSVNDTEWLSEVRAGRKKAAVLRDAEEVFKVQWLLLRPLGGRSRDCPFPLLKPAKKLSLSLSLGTATGHSKWSWGQSLS